MRGRIRVGLSLAFLLALLTWGLQPRAIPDPVVRGKPLSEWLDDRRMPLNEGGILSDETTEATRALGSDAIPTLLAWLNLSDPTFYRESIDLGRTLHLPVGPTRVEMIQDRAHRGFFALGSTARSAWPRITARSAWPRIVDLALHARDDAQRQFAVYSLPEQDPPTLRLLVDGTGSPDPDVRKAAAYALMIRRDAPDEISLPALERLKDDLNPRVRVEAARAIRFIMRELPNFVAALRSSGPRSRAFAARHIGPFRTRARASLPELEAAAADPVPAVRAAVAEAIRQVRPPSPGIMAVDPEVALE